MTESMGGISVATKRMLLYSLLPLCLLFSQHLCMMNTDGIDRAWCQDVASSTSQTFTASQLASTSLVSPLTVKLSNTSTHPILIDAAALNSMPADMKEMFQQLFSIQGVNSLSFSSAQSLYHVVKTLRRLSSKLYNTYGNRQRVDTELANFFSQHNIAQLSCSAHQTVSSWASTFASSNLQGVPVAPLSDMEWILRLKAAQHSDVASALSVTGTTCIVDKNTRGDTFWGMAQDPSGNTFTGENKLGKLWMNVRDKKMPLYVQEWLSCLSPVKSLALTSDMLSGDHVISFFGWIYKWGQTPPGYAASGFQNTFSQLSNYSRYAISVSTSNSTIPQDVRQVFSQIGKSSCTFTTSENLYHFIKALRQIQSSSQNYAQLLSNRNIDIFTCSPDLSKTWSRPYNFAVPTSDMKWILTLKLQQHSDVADALRRTNGAYLIEGNMWNDMRWGMAYNLHTGTFEGENKLGKVWMQLYRENAYQQTQQQPSVTLTSSTTTTARPSVATTTQSTTTTNTANTATTSFFAPSVTQLQQQRAAFTQTTQTTPSTTAASASMFGPRVQFRQQPQQPSTTNTTTQTQSRIIPTQSTTTTISTTTMPSQTQPQRNARTQQKIAALETKIPILQRRLAEAMDKLARLDPHNPLLQ